MASRNQATLLAVCFAALVMAVIAMDDMPGMYMAPTPNPGTAAPPSPGNLVSPSVLMIGFLAFIVTFLGF
ncbi:hypothetical protein OWV82_017243 [Melia azedarach]|uniref:Uncharacterized protein n=1 Tax=Melia azedarach TaxID=155640 RepID=A0ACC1XJM9_MELAZ|nr:hypothetical protein OWV82_017243 [Melia azedarach]